MLAKKPKGAVEKRQGGGLSSLLWIFVGSILTLLIGLALYLLNPFDIGTEEKVEERNVEPRSQPPAESDNYEFYDLLPDQEMITLPDEAVILNTETTEDRDVEPDVVVTNPTVESREEGGSNSDPENYGISEESILNPMAGQQSAAAGDDQEMVIVQEEGTYDGPAESNRGSNAGATQGSNNAQAGNQSASAATPVSSYILQINSYSTAEEADKRRAQVLLAGVDVHVIKNKRNNGQVIYQVVSSPTTNRQNIVAAQQKLQNNGIDSLIVEQRR